MHASSGKIPPFFGLACALILTLIISPKIASGQVPDLTAVVTNSLGISCQAYCVGINGRPYDLQIPRNWPGAYCVNATRLIDGVAYMQVPCTAAYDNVTGETLQCTCTPSDQGRDGQGLGWNQVGYASEVPLKIVNKNNGEMPCQHYCVGVSGGPWNGELSVAWDGASCTATSDPSISCYDYPGKPVKCTCGPTGAGWNMAPFDSAAPICGNGAQCQTIAQDTGSVPCQSYCMGLNGRPWNDLLPAEWYGAICAYTSDPGISCNEVWPIDDSGSKVTCTCMRSGYGWNDKSWPIGPTWPPNQALLSNGNAAASILWAPNEDTVVDSSYALSPTIVGGSGGSDFLIWSKCTIGVFVSSICYIQQGKSSGAAPYKPIIRTMVIGYTDGSKYAVGCGQQFLSTSFANCQGGPLQCISIDVQGGELLTSFEMTQTENSGVATTLGNFKLNTTNTRTGASQYFSIGDGAGIFISVDVGSGMICGMKGRHGDLVDSFGLVFLLPIVSANIENAVSYLSDEFAGAQSSSSVVFEGTYFCPTPGLRVCTNTVAYQQGATSIATVTDTSTFAFALSQEFSMSYEYEKQPKPKPKPEPKPGPVVNNYFIENNNYGAVNVVAMLGGRKLVQSDDRSSHHEMIPARTIKNESANDNTHLSSGNGMVDRRRLFGVKSSFSAIFKTETTDTTTNTFTTKTSDFTTSTFQVNCQCPPGPLDQFCLFENSYASQVSWSSVRWTGDIVVLLKGSDKTLTFPTSGYSTGQYLSVDVVSSPTTCASTPDQVAQPGRRRLNSNAPSKDDATAELANLEDRSSDIIANDLSKSSLKLDDDENSSDVPFQARRLLKRNRRKKKSAKKNKKKAKPRPPSPRLPPMGSIQPSPLNWKTPFDGMISPVLIVGGNTGQFSSEKWFDRCNSMVFVTKIAVDAWYCSTNNKNMVTSIILTYSDGSNDTIGQGDGGRPKDYSCSCLRISCFLNAYSAINIDLQNHERIVSLTMLSQKGAFLGFHIVTEDGYGNSKSSLAGFLYDDMIPDHSNMDTTFQYFPVSVGSGYICGYAARSGNWIDAFGFVFLQPIESSRIDPVSINMADYATPRPFKASVSFQNMPCSITQQAKGTGSCSVTFSDAVTSETTTTIETTHQVVTQKVQKASFELNFGPRGNMGKIGSTTTFDEKWTTSTKSTQTKTTTTVLTPSLNTQCMCPSYAADKLCSFEFEYFDTVTFEPVPWTSNITMVLSTGYEIKLPVSGTLSGSNMIMSSISMTEGPITCI